MIGTTVAHYRVEERLGAGGMGEVWRARDLALGRLCALKVLAPGFDPAMRLRLLREAEASARLQHPAIATFHEAGEHDGIAWIAMEFVNGRTLRQRLRDGALAPADATAIVAALLEALAHAHAAGLLHRDIKPENVMITPALEAKLLDFGLAKHLAPADDPGDTRTELTGAGGVVGTIGYMSPEQLRNEAIDERSDVFQMGAVLYELLAGRPAFPGTTATERIAAILTRDPAPLGPPVAPELAAVVTRALARDRDRRHPSAGAFLADLNAAREGEASAEVAVEPAPTLAVLDFENLSRDPADAWIGSGIAESLATDLSRVAGLSVVGRDKVLKARTGLPPDATDPAVALGLALGCRYVLSGNYQRLGPRLRVTTRLVEVATGGLLAAEKIDGTVDDVFDMQDRLAAATAGSLSLATPAAVARTNVPRWDAFECYARGRRLLTRLEKGSFEQAAELFARAVALQPRHAPALAGLAALTALKFTFTTDPELLEKAAGLAGRALEADPRLAEASTWLGYARFRQGRYAEAAEHEAHAAELDAGALLPLYFGSLAAWHLGRTDDALRLGQRAVDVAPTDAHPYWSLGCLHMERGHLAEARWCLEKAVSLDGVPGSVRTPGAAAYLGECHRRAGDLDAAREHCLAGIENVERSDYMYRDTFRAYGLLTLARTALQQGDRAAAAAATQQVLAHVHGRPRMLAGGTLLVHALALLAGQGEAARRAEAEEVLARRAYDFTWVWGADESEARAEIDGLG